MIFKIQNRPFYWVLWHPHQRIWNWTLITIIDKLIFIKPLAQVVKNCVVKVDTFILGICQKWYPRNINKRGYSPQKQINYFDLGTHKFANELNWIYEQVFSKLPNPKNIFAFEANPESYNIAVDNVRSIKQLKFFNIALVNNIPKSGHIRLYTHESGEGDSIYRINSNSFVDVPAKRLSDVIKDHNIQLSDSINIIRMNIEGCEFDVIEDLIENDLLKFIDGFYGMWDDVSKIDYEKDKRFRKLMKKVSLYPFPFNGRDMQYNSRKKLIEKSLNYSILGKK